MNTETTDPKELEQGDKIIIAIAMPEGYEGTHPDLLFDDVTRDFSHDWQAEYVGIERKQP